MGIQAFVPSGGGGTPGFDYVASIRMETYNRSWTQSGAAGTYILTSNNNNSGYVYFVGATTTGSPLGKVVNVTHAFTRLDIVAPTGDFMSLHKAAVKSTTVFANPFAAFASFPSILTSSGNFVLPTSALPLINAVVVGGGGGGGGDHAGGGGGGGGVVKLIGYQAVGTTSVSIGGFGGNGGHGNGGNGGSTYFGNVFALAGGGGAGSSGNPSTSGLSNGGGGNGHNGHNNAGIGNGSSWSEGTGTQTGTATHHGGHNGTGKNGNHAGGGGGGAGGNATTNANGNTYPGNAGPAHSWDITGSSQPYGGGGPGGAHSPDRGLGSHSQHSGYGHGGHGAHNGNATNTGGGGNGVVIVRYYIA